VRENYLLLTSHNSITDNKADFALVGRICYRCIRRQSQTVWRPLANTLEIYDYLRQHDTRVDIFHTPHAIIGPWYENVMLSTKPELRNILHFHWRRTEPRPQVTCTENSVKLGDTFLEMRVDKQTYDTLHPY